MIFESQSMSPETRLEPMKKLLLILPFFLIGCVTSSNQSGSAQDLTLGTYRASLSMKWYADDAGPRKFVDIEGLLPNGKWNGSIYLIVAADTLPFCEGSSDWKQEGDKLLFWNSQQRCKAPDDMNAGYGNWDASPDTIARTIRSVTDKSFEMLGETVDRTQFWASYTLVP
jgi:hypothetical protein